MSYPVLAVIGVVIAAGGGLAALWRLRVRDGRLPAATAPALLLTMLVVGLLTAVFDNLMIRWGLFHYAPEALSGWALGLAPVEDFSYPLAGALLLPALWLLLARGGRARQEAFAQFVVASRPVSWINTAFPFGAAYLLTTREIDWVFMVGVIYFLIPYNLAMYGINDVFDYASDLANPRKGGIEGALLNPRLHRAMLVTVTVLNLPFLALLASAGGPASWLALSVSTFAVVAYSAPGLRFKERAFLDSATSSTHFVSPAVVGFTLASASFDAPTLVLLGAFFTWGMAAHAFGAIQDILPDRDGGIGSVATTIGARRTARLSLSLWLLAGTAMVFTPWPGRWPLCWHCRTWSTARPTGTSPMTLQDAPTARGDASSG